MEFRGYRLTAQPLLSIDKTLLYGSNDGGHSIHFNSEVDAVMGQVARQLHLARHTVGDKQLWCAGDIECRQAKDSSHAYLLDMARALPPEHPAEAKHLEPIGGVVFYRMLRPEYLARLKSLNMPPLSADALSNWGTGTGSRMHNSNIRMATRFLVTTVIPQLADDIKQNQEMFKQSISSFVHKAGVNIR